MSLGGGGKPRVIQPPPVPDPVPTLEQIDTEAIDVGQRARRRRKGRQSLILTDTLGVSDIAPTTQASPRNSLLGQA
jgi:hypothetical protein